MDPTATLRLLLDAFQEQDREAAVHLLMDLLDWISKGGALPEDNSESGTASLAAKHLRVAAQALLVHAASCERRALLGKEPTKPG